MAAAHKTRSIRDPLEHLDQIDKKPWAYTSGGTMSGLVSSYFRLEQPPAEAARWVESPTELLVFLVDAMKQTPPKIMEEFLVDPDKSMLIHSPTHAFLLKPGNRAFSQLWQSDTYTYTWIRDTLIQKQENFVRSLWLDQEKMHFLIQYLVRKVPENYQYYFKKVFGSLYGNMLPFEFREFILEGIRKDRGLRQSGQAVLSRDEIDSAFYTLLPLTSRQSLRDSVERIFGKVEQLGSERRQHLMQLFDLCLPPFSQEALVSAERLQEICKALLCMEQEETSSELDIHSLISHAAASAGLAMPPPLVFADSNWVKDYFGFVFNPGSARLELWRVDETGRAGAPMSHWEQWLDGSHQDPKWGIYTKPYEYRV
jgi:hypothetical protein